MKKNEEFLTREELDERLDIYYIFARFFGVHYLTDKGRKYFKLLRQSGELRRAKKRKSKKQKK